MTAEQLAFELFKHLTLNESYVGAYQGSGQTPGATVIDGDIDLTALAQAALDAVQAKPAPVGEPVGLAGLRQREVQALHAGLSRRDWHATETAANQLRDKIDVMLRAAPVPSQEITDEMVEAGAREWFGVNTWDQKPPSEREFYIGVLRETIRAAIAAPVPSQDVERLRAALLNRVRYDNDCLCHVSDPDCTGWDADKCGCAIEARAELKGADRAQAK